MAFLLNCFKEHSSRIKAWLWLWGGLSGFLILSRIVAKDWQSIPFLILQFCFWLLVSWLWLPRKWLPTLFFCVALLFTFGGFVQRWLLSNSWRTTSSSSGQIEQAGLTGQGAVNIVSSSSQGRAGLRSWRLDPVTQDLKISLELRLVGGQMNWFWFGKEAQLESMSSYTRWYHPKGQISRRFYIGEPLRDKTFRVSFQARSAEAVCGRLRFIDRPVSVRSRQELCTSTAWQSFSFEWKPSAEAQGKFLEIVLDNVATTYFDIAQVKLERWQDGWLDMPPAAPTGVGIGLIWADKPAGPSPEFRFLPSSEWQTYTFSYSDAQLLSKERLLTYLDLEPSLAVEVKNVVIQSLTPGTIQPIALPRVIRQTLFSPHANLAGHMIAVVTLSYFVLGQSIGLGTVALIVSVASIWLTGSRTAFLAILLAFMLLLYFMAKRRRWLIYSICAVMLAGSIGFFGLSRLGRLIEFDNEATPRPEIWRLAWQVFRENPLTGLSSEEFRGYALERGVGVEAGGVTHAHNFLLYLASTYGIFGLIASLWLTGGLLWLAWNWGRWRALAFIVPIFFMNIFDVSLFYIGVILPLCLVLNSFWKQSNIKAR